MPAPDVLGKGTTKPCHGHGNQGPQHGVHVVGNFIQEQFLFDRLAATRGGGRGRGRHGRVSDARTSKQPSKNQQKMCLLLFVVVAAAVVVVSLSLSTKQIHTQTQGKQQLQPATAVPKKQEALLRQ